MIVTIVSTTVMVSTTAANLTIVISTIIVVTNMSSLCGAWTAVHLVTRQGKQPTKLHVDFYLQSTLKSC